MSHKADYDVLIIGGGIIGSAINYELSKYHCTIVQLEKNCYLADETTAGNSGIVHGGFDADTNKIQAKLNVRGNFLWHTEIIPHLRFPYHQLPSLVLAFNDEEIKELNVLYQRGLANGVPAEALKIIDRKEIIEREPLVNPSVKQALLCTTSIVIDPIKATLALAGAAAQNGSQILRNSEVTNITWREEGYFEVQINHQRYLSAKFIVNAAGHQADIIANKSHLDSFQQVCRRGEYKILAKDEQSKIKNICFLTPSIHGKGILVLPMTNGRVLLGPSAKDNIIKADTRLLDPSVDDRINAIAHKIIPSLDLSRVETRVAGSRPIASATNDFVIGYAKHNQQFINAAGMQSPGISSAPAIAKKVVELILAVDASYPLKNNFKPDFIVLW